jgi:hypothetical protein
MRTPDRAAALWEFLVFQGCTRERRTKSPKVGLEEVVRLYRDSILIRDRPEPPVAAELSKVAPSQSVSVHRVSATVALQEADPECRACPVADRRAAASMRVLGISSVEAEAGRRSTRMPLVSG